MEFYAHTPTEDEERETIAELLQKMQGTDLVDKYRSHHYKPWEEDPCSGYTVLGVLPQFAGKRLDNSLVAYLHTLRPSCVRISYGEVTTDSKPWRVTVIIEKRDGVDYIRDISQEVCIGFGSGYHVENTYRHLHEGGPSPEVFPKVVGNLAGILKADFS